MAAGPKVTKTMSWADIPTCREAGVPIDAYQMPRTIWLAAGVPQEVVSFYSEVMDKVRHTPEWKAYIERTSQTAAFMSGDELRKYIEQDTARAGGVFEREKWLAR